jgi:competence protein ComFB
MALTDRYDLSGLRNEAAEMVCARIERLLTERPDVCSCNSCVLDLVAFILNRVTPRYATSLLGDLHPDPVRLKRMQVEIDLGIRAGLQRLALHPHHD